MNNKASSWWLEKGEYIMLYIVLYIYILYTHDKGIEQIENQQAKRENQRLHTHRHIDV